MALDSCSESLVRTKSSRCLEVYWMTCSLRCIDLASVLIQNTPLPPNKGVFDCS